MKKTRILMAAALLCACKLTAQTTTVVTNVLPALQTNVVTTTVVPLSSITDTPSFFGSVLGYFSSFDTNSTTFKNMRGGAQAGVASIQKGGVTLANDITLFIAPSALRGFGVEASIRDSGVAGTIVSVQGGIAYHYVIYDVDLTPYAHGGSWLMTGYKKAYGEIGVRAAKALTTHTYSGIGFGVQLPDGGRVYSAFAGFTF